MVIRTYIDKYILHMYISGFIGDCNPLLVMQPQGTIFPVSEVVVAITFNKYTRSGVISSNDCVFGNLGGLENY